MATTTCATISHTHAHPLSSHSQKLTLPFSNLPSWSTKNNKILGNLTSFHVKVHTPSRASISPLSSNNDDKNASVLIDTVSIPPPDTDRVPKMMSSRAKRAQQSSQRRVHVSTPSPPLSDSGTISASRPYALKASASTAAVPAITVNTKLKPTISNSSDNAALKTAPSFTITPSEVVHRYIQDEWGMYPLNSPAGPPTRGHWRLDHTASCCAFSTCTVVFSLLNRRHHCRRCGDIFCCQHSMLKVPLDHEARIHTDGVFERACENCYEDYQIWKHASKSRANSVASATAAAAKPVVAPPVVSPGAANDSPFIDHPMYVPRNMRPQIQAELNPLLSGSGNGSNSGSGDSRIIDYNWSTF